LFWERWPILFEVVILRVIPELTLDEYVFLCSLCSLEKRERINRFYSFGDAQNSLIGDVLVRVELCRITGLSNRELAFSVNSHDKPFLTNDSQVHYNISHANKYITCVISDVSVGIDIETVKPFDVKIVERFFTPDEQTYVLSSQGDMRNKRFFEVWTKKESRIKWAGRGLFESVSSFSVLNSLEQSEIFYHCIYDNGEIIGHVCSSKKEKPSIKIIDTPILLQKASLLK